MSPVSTGPIANSPPGTPAWRRARALLRVTRPHQWSKNVLLVLPALAAHTPLTAPVLGTLALGMLGFAMVSSTTYIFNDYRDVEQDRRHPTKRHRPFATGELGPVDAVVLTVLLGLVVVTVTWTLPPRFAGLLCSYAVLSLVYSSALKRRLLVDVVTLAGLYTLRVVAGAELLAIPLSAWFLPFSVFLFVSLALAKRVTELVRLGGALMEKVGGRAYMAADVQVLVSLGMAASTASALVFCLYVTSHDVLRMYHTPELLWAGLPLLLYWQARIWIFAVRGSLNDDPVVFALRDRVSFLVTATFLLTVWLAS